MIKVIGKRTCTSCLMAKKTLTRNNIEFVYIGLDEISKEEQDTWIEKAKTEGRSSLPFIIKDDKFVELKDVISNVR